MQSSFDIFQRFLLLKYSIMSLLIVIIIMVAGHVTACIVKGQLCEVGSLLSPLHGFQEWNPSCQASLTGVFTYQDIPSTTFTLKVVS